MPVLGGASMVRDVIPRDDPFDRPPPRSIPLPPSLRVVLVLLALSLVAGFALARSLTPAPAGFGTHQQLGFPPCTTRALWNIPCPACGMTTSFAHFTRLQLPSALRANASGVLLAVLSLLAIPWSLVAAWRGRLVGEQWFLADRWLWLTLTWLGCAVTEWGLRRLCD
ncbi:MAG: DUF2752 domain-containing protein [Planctomycetaceae bacterium]